MGPMCSLWRVEFDPHDPETDCRYWALDEDGAKAILRDLRRRFGRDIDVSIKKTPVPLMALELCDFLNKWATR